MAAIVSTTAASFGQNRNRDLLRSFDSSKNAVKGEWQLEKSELRVKSGKGAVCRLPGTVGKTYTLTAEFTRQSGEDVVAFIVPIGGTSVAVELSSWQGTSHGMARVDGQSSRSEQNPTATRPGTLQNGKRYRVDIAVSEKADQPAIEVRLDEKKLFDWTGQASRLQPHFAFQLEQADTVGLASSDNDVVFHRVSINERQPTDAEAAPKPSKPAPSPTRTKQSAAKPIPGPINLTSLGKTDTPGWEPFNGARFTTDRLDGKAGIQSLPNAGSGDRGAYLRGVTFREGVIDVELKGSNQRGRSFLGVVFHGLDGETYDAVYFRPFNFKAANNTNRIHAVQYISHPDWPWQKLRAQRNGQFEKQANPEPNGDEWFKARIEVKGNRVRVFVNGSKTACLDVEKLNDRKSGKVGLWFNGIASFANLSVTTAK